MNSRKPPVAPPRPTLAHERFGAGQINPATRSIQPKCVPGAAPAHRAGGVPQPPPRAAPPAPPCARRPDPAHATNLPRQPPPPARAQARAAGPGIQQIPRRHGAPAPAVRPLPAAAPRPAGATPRQAAVQPMLRRLATGRSTTQLSNLFSKGGGGGEDPRKPVKLTPSHYLPTGTPRQYSTKVKVKEPKFRDITDPGKGKVTDINITSTTLAYNLNKSYGVKGKEKSPSYEGHQAHHVIPKELAEHPTVANSEFYLDDPANGIYLPDKRIPGTGSTIHRGSHPNYTAAVEHFLSNVPPGETPESWIWIVQQALQLVLREGRLRMSDSTEDWISVIDELLNARYYPHK